MLNELVVNELQELQEEHQGFKVMDLDGANWCFRKKAAIAQQAAEYKKLAEKEKQRIENWLNCELAKLSNQDAFFDGLLTEYSLEQRRLNPKFKLSTPYGKVSFRKQQPKWNIEDEILLHNLKSSGLNDLIRVKEEVNKVELKKAAEVVNGQAVIDGEILEGVEVIEQDEAIKIEVSEL